MGFKKTREAKVVHIGRLPVHRFEDRDGVQTSVGVDQMVQVVLEVTDGPDAGREVRLAMTREDAAEHIQRVQLAIDAAAEQAAAV